MKRILVSILIVLSIFSITGCGKKIQNEKALAFKEDYEKLNGTKNKNGKEHRTISIDNDNPFIEVNAEDILNKIENNETFYVYFGSSLCPWCRSIIESAIKVAKYDKINTIYYVDVWDEEGNEILRDAYSLENDKPVKTLEGTETYYKLLEYFKDYLRDYTLTGKNEKTIEVGEKRIYAPNFMYIENGTIKKLTNGKSSLQTDSRGELTEEIKKEQEEQFKNFFDN